MAATGTVTAQATISGLQSGSRNVGPLTVNLTNANGQVTDLVLASGANTVTVPASPATNGCIIIFDPTSTVAKTLKGVTGDTGIAVGKVNFAVLTWDPTAPPASFVITAASADTGKVTEVVFF